MNLIASFARFEGANGRSNKELQWRIALLLNRGFISVVFQEQTRLS